MMKWDKLILFKRKLRKKYLINVKFNRIILFKIKIKKFHKYKIKKKLYITKTKINIFLFNFVDAVSSVTGNHWRFIVWVPIRQNSTITGKIKDFSFNFWRLLLFSQVNELSGYTCCLPCMCHSFFVTQLSAWGLW